MVNTAEKPVVQNNFPNSWKETKQSSKISLYWNHVSVMFNRLCDVLILGDVNRNMTLSYRISA